LCQLTLVPTTTVFDEGWKLVPSMLMTAVGGLVVVVVVGGSVVVVVVVGGSVVVVVVVGGSVVVVVVTVVVGATVVTVCAVVVVSAATTDVSVDAPPHETITIESTTSIGTIRSDRIPLMAGMLPQLGIGPEVLLIADVVSWSPSTRWG
jgi:hypothetical protein